jgi:hypothetical protein
LVLSSHGINAFFSEVVAFERFLLESGRHLANLTLQYFRRPSFPVFALVQPIKFHSALKLFQFF